jgi:hypothetical protein
MLIAGPRGMFFVRLLCALLLFTACSGDDDGATDGDISAVDAAASAGDGAAADAAASGFGVDIVERTCGPADGPAITLKLGAAYDPETCTIDFDDDNLTINVYLDEVAIEAPVTFTFDAEALTGSAQSCPGGEGACRSATSGEVHFDSFTEDEGASGTFELTMDGGGPVSGSFDASWCESEGGGPYCG